MLFDFLMPGSRLFNVLFCQAGTDTGNRQFDRFFGLQAPKGRVPAA